MARLVDKLLGQPLSSPAMLALLEVQESYRSCHIRHPGIFAQSCMEFLQRLLVHAFGVVGRSHQLVVESGARKTLLKLKERFLRTLDLPTLPVDLDEHVQGLLAQFGVRPSGLERRRCLEEVIALEMNEAKQEARLLR